MLLGLKNPTHRAFFGATLSGEVKLKEGLIALSSKTVDQAVDMVVVGSFVVDIGGFQEARFGLLGITGDRLTDRALAATIVFIVVGLQSFQKVKHPASKRNRLFAPILP